MKNPKYVTVSATLQQAEDALAMLVYCLGPDAAKWTNGCRRRADGLRRALEAALREAKKNVKA